MGVSKKQTAVSHSSIETEIISFDAGFRIEGIPAMHLRDTIWIYCISQLEGDSKPVHQTQILNSQEPLGNMDHVPPYARLFSMRSSSYIF